MSKEIAIIGAGVNGITAGITLQLLGYETHIYARETLSSISDKNNVPEFGSLYPAASIIPHSVSSDRLSNLFRPSQTVFNELRKHAFPGVTSHKHFEIFEQDTEQPAYGDLMLNLETIEELDSASIPTLSDSQNINGWAFDCIFTDWPRYFPALISLYNNIGGDITRQSFQPDDIEGIPASTIVNCSGTGSPVLFDDPVDNHLLLQGHLLHKPEAPLITSGDGAIISYNYTPQSSTYADAEGKACDVYCYPRKDGWVLGGSRRLGQLDGDHNFNPVDPITVGKTYEIDSITFPAQIIDLNERILQHTFDLSIGDKDKLTPSVGYRYIRTRKNGLRLKKEVLHNKTIVHNYGHGGAGVSLSWGCAIEIAHMLSAEKKPALSHTIMKELTKIDFSG